MTGLKKAALAVSSVLGCFMLMNAAFGEPLLQEGKKSVYQRAVSHPNAVLYSTQDARQAIGKPRTFTSYYLFAKTPKMVQVGVSAEKPDGWLKVEDITEWPQAITMVFTDQMGRDPVLFFKDHEAVVKACESESIQKYMGQYVQLFANKARIPDNSPVIAAEPMGKEGQVSKNRFYLLPVTNIDTQFKESGTQLLEVASIDPGKGPASAKEGSERREGAPNNNTQPVPDKFKTGITFVIDTTISMKPYIDQSVEVVKKIFDELQKSPAKNDVEIAVVAFRSNMQKSPGIGYTTKVISDFKGINQRQDLERLLRQVKEATVSTHAFDEDSYAGVKDAVDQLSWNKFNSRVILLLTDAGPLKEGDPTSRTGMSAEGLADYLREHNIYLTALHIKAPSGKKDHDYAEKAYRELSKMSNNRSSYIDVKVKSHEEGAKQFEAVSRMLASTYRNVVESTNNGRILDKPKQEEKKGASPEERAKQIAELTGYAMQLQFAGAKNRTEAPQVVKAWIADSDLAALEQNPNDAPIPAVYPAVLLTKTQLSLLRKQLKSIIETAEEAFLLDTENFNFYEQLISAAAQMSRDPTKFNADPKANLAQKGVLLEVLDGLPYKSRVIGLKKEDWVNMSTGEQQEFIKRLKGLIARYDEYDKDSANWEGFGSQNSNEWVYRVPLTMLP